MKTYGELPETGVCVCQRERERERERDREGEGGRGIERGRGTSFTNHFVTMSSLLFLAKLTDAGYGAGDEEDGVYFDEQADDLDDDLDDAIDDVRLFL